jgi:tetratricopeptide (TPR) repeat protein
MTLSNNVEQLYKLWEYKKIIELEKEITVLWYDQFSYEALWWSYMRIWEYKKAISFFKTTYAHDLSSRRSLYGLATSYFHQEKFASAVVFYKKFLVNNKNLSLWLHVEVLNNIWLSFLHRWKFDDAIWWYMKAMKIDRTDPDLYNNIGMAYHYLWNDKKALEYFLEWYKLAPDDDDLRNKIIKTQEILKWPTS